MEAIQQFIDSLTANQDIIPFLIIVLGGFLIGILMGLILRRGAVRRLKKELEKKGEQIIDLQGQLNAATQKLSLQDTELQKTKQKFAETSNRLRIMEEENGKLQKTVFHLNSEYDKIKSSGQSFESTFDDLNNQLIGYKSQIEELQAQLDEAIKAKEYAERKLDSIANTMPSENVSIKTEEIEEPINEEGNIVVYENDEGSPSESQVDDNDRLAALEERLEQLFEVNVSLQKEIDQLKARPVSNTQPVAKPPIPDSGERGTSGDEHFPEDAADLALQQPFKPSNGQSDDSDLIVEPTPPKVAPIEAPEPIDIPKSEPPVEKDNLTLIEGIGPFLENKLNGIGIFTYQQISEFDAEQIEEVTKSIQFFEGRIQKDNWVGQAKSLYQIKIQNPTAFNLVPQGSELFTQAPEPTDNLQIIEGIGPKIEQLLNDAGFLNIADIANASAAHLKEVLDNAGDAFKMHDPSTWPTQAQIALSGETGLLQDYQDTLRGGREE